MQTLPRVVPTLLLVALLAGCAAADNPAPREVPTYTIEQFMGTTKLNGASFSTDGEKILVSSDERDPRYMDLYEMSLDGYERTLLYRSEAGLDVDAISPDRRLLTLIQPIDNNNTDLRRVAAEANGVAVEYIVFPDEGHGFRKKKNQLRGNQAVLGFLERHLKGAEAASAP